MFQATRLVPFVSLPLNTGKELLVMHGWSDCCCELSVSQLSKDRIVNLQSATHCYCTMKIHHVVPLLLLASVLATAVACPVQPPALQLHDIGSDGSVADALQYASDLIGGVINNTKVPGAVAIVVQGDDIVWSKGFGLQNVSNPMQGQPNVG